MIRNYRDLTRWEMEQVDRENTIVLIPLGALEQHGNQAPLGTDDIIAEAMSQEIKKALEECLWPKYGNRVVIHGFVDAMQDLMAQSDEPVDRELLRQQVFKISQYADAALGYQRLQSLHNDLALTDVPLYSLCAELVKKLRPIFLYRKILDRFGACRIRNFCS